MLKDFFENISSIRHSKLKGNDKRNALFTLQRLSFKNKYVLKKSTEVSASFFGYKISAYDYASLHFLFKEIFCFDDYFFTTNSKEPFIIDCGANIGMASIYFKKLFPYCRITCFEANPPTFQLLKKNIEQNSLKNVDLHNIALYNKEDTISFFIDKPGTLTGSIHEGRGGATAVEIKAKRLSSYIKDIEKIDLIKMDVEGAEINIIDDLFETGLLKKADQYIIEYHHNIEPGKQKLSDFLSKFESCGFNYSIKANYKNLKSNQDILLHFYK